MRYTHFVFDIDNTLINTTGAVLHGLQFWAYRGWMHLNVWVYIPLNRYSRFIPVGNSMNRSISTLPICMRALSLCWIS